MKHVINRMIVWPTYGALFGGMVWMAGRFLNQDIHGSEVEDRAIIERVYHEQRIGMKEPFEKIMPESVVRDLVYRDNKRERLLAAKYGIVPDEKAINDEVSRINASTRAPASLSKIKAALGHDPLRFAMHFAKPVLVDRLLHQRFVADANVHAPARRAADQVRHWLLEDRPIKLEEFEKIAKKNGVVGNSAEVMLDFGSSIEPNRVSEGFASASSSYQIEASVESTNDSKELTGRDERAFSFNELPADLGAVLDAQLRHPGDVSAVIETDHAFHVYITRLRNAKALKAGCITLHKMGLDEWVAKQPDV